MRGAGFRLDVVYPADDPRTAILTLDDRTVRLTGPNAPSLPESLPPIVPEFVLTRAGDAAGEGRAGMLYRDLIPGRLGGLFIASHITIPDGGPVDDWVHYHRIAFQLIVVRRGWVRVVYEDQGEPFVMREGDMVLQPPEIRHRVLESSAKLEVIEIGAPAVHPTLADHALELPGGRNPERLFSGQRFLHHVAASAPWSDFGSAEAQETGLSAATGGLADARIIHSRREGRIEFAGHSGELVFGFVLEGTATLDHGGGHDLAPADAFVIPPGEAWSLGGLSDDFRLLHVTTARLDGAA